jgi:rhamnogalacturonan hydrolase
MWTDTGSSVLYSCANAYGSGACLKSGSGTASYAAVKQTVTTKPSSYSAATMPWDLKSAFGSTVSIPIPTMPSSFYPSATPIKALASSKKKQSEFKA